jgi:Na+-transporting methylmalonyl-CoA/oxaloacetate decarboxylase gamma subunit
MTHLLGSDNLMLQGLAITVVGMSLVFAALALIWVLITVLGRVVPSERRVAGAPALAVQNAGGEQTGKRVAERLTVERAQVAAIAAAALTAGALPMGRSPGTIESGLIAPDAGAFEHGRTAPSWVTANRARALQPWQPARRPES